MEKRGERHIPFFELKEACAKPGCPVCGLVKERTAKYLDNLLYEHVTDRGFRAHFRAAGGFCFEHSRDLVSYKDGLAVAILHRDLIGDRVEEFRRGKGAVKRKLECPVCVESRRIEAHYLGLLAEGDEELKAAYLASEGLCVPHYGRALECVGRLPRWWSDFQEGIFKRLVERTDKFIEYSAYGRKPDFDTLSPEDKLVWKELASKLRGELG